MLIFTTNEILKIKEKAVWFLRTKFPADTTHNERKLKVDNENDIIFGEIPPNATFSSALNNV